MKTEPVALTFLHLLASALTAGSFARTQNAAGLAIRVQAQAPQPIVCLGDMAKFEQVLTLVRQYHQRESCG